MADGPETRADLQQPPPRRSLVVGALGCTQILAWGSSFYLPAVLITPIVADTGWPRPWVTGGLSAALLMAALVSAAAGRHVALRGGRVVLATSALLLGAGLAVIGIAPNFPVFLLGWVVISAGMGAGLYDAAFATLGTLYGQAARGPITTITLYGGFASALCWPLSAVLVEHFGWRGTCLVYAAIQIGLSFPLLLMAVPPGPKRRALSTPEGLAGQPRVGRPVMLTIAAALVVSAGVSSIVAVQLLTLLQETGASFQGAVALGMLMGPVQVAARVVEALVGPRYHPVWTMLAAAALMAAGLLLMIAGAPLGAAALIVYAAGNGLWSITRGSVPLAILGSQGYAVNMGRLVRPALIASALAPYLAGLLYERGGAALSQQIIAGLAVLNVLIVIMLAVASGTRSSV